MNHDKDCDCPIHIIEDTTHVKHAAWGVIIFFVALFFLTGCNLSGSCDLPSIKKEAEQTCKARGSRVAKIFDMHCTQNFRCEDGYEYDR